MALLTNKPLEQSMKILEVFELAKYFQWVVGGDGPWPRKPAPDGMRFLMSQASASPGETMLVGDSTVDLETSRNAGVRICLARYGFGFADLPAEELRGDESLVDTPAEIAGVLHAGDSEGWSGEGAFTQTVLERLRTVDQVAAMKVEDAPATRSEADYNFIANEIFVTLRDGRTPRAIKRLGSFRARGRDRQGDDVRRSS